MKQPPPSMSELEALLPWAHFEVEAGEIVIYTGLELDDDEETTLWMTGMYEGGTK